MQSKIFTFTGMGNSLAIAREIADSLGETQILPMADSLDGFAGSDEARLGLVFPVYISGLPRLVIDFVRGFNPNRKQYVFAVADCESSPGRALIALQALLRVNGSDLNAGFAVRGDFMADLPGADRNPVIRLLDRLARGHEPPRASKRLPQIIDVVSARRGHRPEKGNPSVNVVGTVLHGFGLKILRRGDSAFSATDACASCGTCVRLCPRRNVTLSNGRPVWHHNCELCYACYLWCPQRAISCRGVTPVPPTHHPSVRLADMLLR